MIVLVDPFTRREAVLTRCFRVFGRWVTVWVRR